MGIREGADGSIVDPALAAFAAKRQASKAEVMKQTRLAQERRDSCAREMAKVATKKKKRGGSPLGNPEEKGYQS